MKGMNTMNAKLSTQVVFSATMMFYALHCTGQSNVVYYGTNSNALDVVFVDTNLSAKAKSAIVADLNLCLSEWGKKGEVRLWDDEDTAGYLYIGTVCPHYPDDIDFPKDLVETPNGVALQITKELSDAYANAFALAKANAKAFAAANAFVVFVSSTNFANLPSQKLPDYLLCQKETPEEIIARAQKNISELGYQTYYPPSVLGFKRIPLGPKGIFSNSNLWMIIPCSTTPSYTDMKEWSGFPAIWHKGKWKFCFWDEKE